MVAGSPPLAWIRRFQHFAFTAPVVGRAFSGVFTTPGALYFDKVVHVLYGNTDGDSAAEFAIKLAGVGTLTAADLIL
jgi:hypothetical protein